MCTSSRTRCDTSVSCWFSSTCLTTGLNLNSEPKQVLDQALQLDAVVTQDRRDFPLAGVECTDGPIHQQFGALADVGQWCLELM
jgi:hypothetical protein